MYRKKKNGTCLGDKDAEGAYLSSVAAATAVTKETLALFVEYGVEPVIESSVRTAKEMEQATAMLMAPAEDAATEAGGAGGKANVGGEGAASVEGSAAGRGAEEVQSGGGQKRPHNAGDVLRPLRHPSTTPPLSVARQM